MRERGGGRRREGWGGTRKGEGERGGENVREGESGRENVREGESMRGMG